MMPVQESQSLLEFAYHLLGSPRAVAASIAAAPGDWTPAGSLLAVALVFGAVHGLGMGIQRGMGAAVAWAVKMPLVPVLSVAISAPLLHAVSTASGTGIGIAEVAALSLLPVATACVLCGTAAPIFALYGRTSNYHTAKLVNVGIYIAAMVYAMATLHTVLGTAEAPGGGSARGMFRMWMLLFALVGCQVAWVLRPYLGDPSLPYAFWRPLSRDRGAFWAVANSVRAFLGRGD